MRWLSLEDCMRELMRGMWSDEGQDIAEYAVMLAVILVLVVGTIRLVGSNANNAFSSVASTIHRIKIAMGWSDTGFFSEKYRVVAVEAERLTIQGIITGTVLTIINSDPATPLTAEQYPLGKLIALSDPSASPPH